MALSGQQLTLGITLPLLALGGAAIKSFMDMEKLQLGLARVAGSSEVAKKQMAQLRKIALRPGIGFEEALKGSLRLQSMGQSAEFAAKLMGGLANAVALGAGGREEFARAMNQINQSLAKGKIEMQDWKIITENALPIQKAMNDMFGTTDVRAATAGRTAKEFWEIMAVGMARMGEGPDTVANAWDNLRTEVKLSLSEIGALINESFDLKGVMTKVADAVKKAVKWFGDLSPEMQKVILKSALALAAIGPLMTLLGNFSILLANIPQVLGALAKGLVFLGPLGIILVGVIGGVLKLAAAVKTWGTSSKKWKRHINDIFDPTGGTGIHNRKSELKAQAFFGLSRADQAEYDKIRSEGSDLSGAGITTTMGLILGNQAGTKNARLKKLLGGSGTPAADDDDPTGGGKPTSMLDRLAMGFGYEDLDEMLEHGDRQAQALRQFTDDMAKVAIDQIKASQKVSEMVAEIMKELGVIQSFSIGNIISRNIRGRQDKPKPDVAPAFQEAGSNFGLQIQEIGAALGVKKLGRLGDIADKSAALFAQLQGIIIEGFQSRVDALENYYLREKELIKQSGDTEEGKKNRLMKLEEEVDKRRAKLQKKAARRQKLSAIFQGIMSGALAVLQALATGGPIFAAIVGALAAVQVGIIAAAPLPLAHGGIAYGSTYANVGEYAGARTNPEVIAPLDKLTQLMGMSGQRIEVVGRLVGDGDEMYAVIENANRSRRSSGAPFFSQEF